jgi:leader peptidase (prepilin peptidase) / N-methyltransferase
LFSARWQTWAGLNIIAPMSIIGTVLISLVIFLAGAAVGSFLNVVADRVPSKKSIVSPPSHCDNCGRTLGKAELIPIFSYIGLKGKCRDCGASIPLRVLLVEIGTGLLYVLLLQRYGLSLEFGVLCLYSGLFIALSLIDLMHGILPNAIIYPAMPVALIIYVFLGQNLTGLNTNFFQWNFGFAFLPALLNSLVGGIISFTLLLIVVILSRGGMGMGDVKLAGLIGLMTGFPLSIISLFITIITGGMVAVVLLLSRLRKRRDPVPFGPFLCLGALAAIIWGRDIILWYLGAR